MKIFLLLLGFICFFNVIWTDDKDGPPILRFISAIILIIIPIILYIYWIKIPWLF